MQYIRIERRLGRFPMMLSGKHSWNEVDWEYVAAPHTPGFFIFARLFGRRIKSSLIGS